MNINLIKTDLYMPCKAVAHMSQVDMDVAYSSRDAGFHRTPVWLKLLWLSVRYILVHSLYEL